LEHPVFEKCCEPVGPRFPDNHGKFMGYVEGWGKDADTSGKCMTNEVINSHRKFRKMIFI